MMQKMSHLGVPNTFFSSSDCSSLLRVAKASSARGRPRLASGARGRPLFESGARGRPPRFASGCEPISRPFFTNSLTGGLFFGRWRIFLTLRLLSTIFPVFFFLGLARPLALLITGVAFGLNRVLTFGRILPSLSTWKLSEDSEPCRSLELGGGCSGVREALNESLLVV